MNGSTIIQCKCKSAYQDKRYGPGIRVHNHMRGKSEGRNEARCTVCGSVKKV